MAQGVYVSLHKEADIKSKEVIYCIAVEASLHFGGILLSEHKRLLPHPFRLQL